tara:strand:- start:1116 stop:1424 length:309 start_codon:yes stop_codon:yes gene_type:complete
MKNIPFLIIILLVLVSCSGFQEAGKILRNEKTNTTDEFLVKKKEPLIMPPDMNKVPEPESIKNKKENEEEKIKKILKIPNSSSSSNNSKSSTEDLIIDKIRK